MTVTMPDGYYDRFDATKNYDRHLYRVGRVVQGAELNETQLASQDRLKRISDALFKDGGVVRDAAISINQTTGSTSLGSGVIYARGAMRGVAPANLTIPLIGTVSVGIYLQDVVVTELQDPGLKDPALDSDNASEPGAARLQVNVVWGLGGDGTSGDFYPVYTVVDGEVLTPDPPASIDAVSLAIAAYDRDSTGGFYVVNGLDLSILSDDGSGNQVYSLAAGNARVNGKQVLLQHGRRIVYPATADLKNVLAEPHVAVGGTETVTLNHGPISTVDQVLIVTQRVVTLQHGAFNGASDVLPNSPVSSIVAVNQGGTWNGTSFTGGTNYTGNTDYTLTADSVNWSLPGAEPAPSSTYTVVFRYFAQVSPSNLTSTTFQVTGAVAGTTIQASYHWKRPRIDRLCLDSEGNTVWVQGPANDVTPRAPSVPYGLLNVASVNQTWDSSRSITVDRIQMQAMDQLQSLETKVDNLFAVTSELMLKTAAALSDPTTKRGIFVDNFDDDDLRDPGISQNAAITNGALTLPSIGVNVYYASLGTVQTLPLDTAHIYAAISQPLRTGCLQVNPYQAFDPIPASCHIEPAVDFWMDAVTVWLSPITKRFRSEREVTDRFSSLGWLTRVYAETSEVVTTSRTDTVSVQVSDEQYLRQIVINFTLNGFGAGEVLNKVTFDGISVTFTA